SDLNDCAEAGDQLPVYRTSPPEPWREFRAKRWVQEGSTLPKSELVGAGVVTSSAGITVYRGDAYPPQYRDFVFVADVAGNLFYRMKLVPDGVTFKAVQVDGTKNFCTSDDLWCRPVNFVNAPDGCLHVCDMYREVIEHPWSIPDDIHTAVDLLRGRDKGRLYRLAPKSFKSRATPKLSTATTPDLVALLDHPNAWHRETAQRLLFERQDKAAVEPLRQLVKNAATPQGKAHALHSLNAQLSLSEDLVMLLLAAADPHVRRTTLDAVSAWPHMPTKLEDAVLALATDTSPEVRMSLSFLLGGPVSPRIPRLEQLVLSGVNDAWQRRALLSLPPLPLAAVSFTVLKPPETPDTSDFLQHCFLVAGSYRPMPADKTEVRAGKDLMHMMLAVLKEHEKSHPVSLEAGLTGLSQGLAKQGLRLSDIIEDAGLKAWLASIVHLAAQNAVNEKLPIESRQRSARLLSLAVFDSARGIALQLLAPGIASELQQTALEVLGGYQEPAVADILIDAWPKLTPALREKATTLLLSRTDRIAKLLDAIESKKILPSQLSTATKATLGRQKTPALAERIAKLIGDGGSSNRKEVITKYEPILSMTGDPTHGAKIYETLCMVCHRHLDRGNDVGPNLGTIKAWTAEQILTNVLDPNREVSPNFALYIVETNDGRTLSGLITSETAGNLTLKRADGGTDTVLRSEIKSLTSPGISLMPEGLEAAITPQQMADLIAYLKFL
ncbi:MAG: hypothetical protein JWR15_1611, partial [Prosthecobacter sp.]|nr:hypothetical protein [Prosthecobacter sp.]